jgi:hypothetical protein
VLRIVGDFHSDRASHENTSIIAGLFSMISQRKHLTRGFTRVTAVIEANMQSLFHPSNRSKRQPSNPTPADALLSYISSNNPKHHQSTLPSISGTLHKSTLPSAGRVIARQDASQVYPFHHPACCPTQPSETCTVGRDSSPGHVPEVPSFW